MKNLMQRISFIVAVAIMTTVLSTGFCVGAAESGSLLTSNEEGVLRYLKVVTESEPDYGKEITRGELAHIAAKVMNVAAYAGEGSYFYDVPESNAYYQDIHALVDAGILHGDGNGYYRPLDKVSELEIAKVFTVILGYGAVAEYDSYQNIARRAGVTDGTDQNGVVTYAEALLMAYNTLHCGMFEAITYGEEPTYQASETYLAIQCYHNLVYQTGLVKGVWGTDLQYPNESVEKGELLIGGRCFVWNDETLLGKNVVFYSPYDKSIGMGSLDIKYIYVDEAKTSVLEIPAEDIQGLTSDKSGYNYYTDGKEKTAKLTQGFDVIYNGVAHPSYDKADLKPDFGSVTLIDNDNDSQYDVVVVQSWQYLQISMTDYNNNKIYASYPDGFVLGEKDALVTVLVDGKESKLNRLKAGLVVGYKESKNTAGDKKIVVEKLAEGTEGTIESFGSDTVTLSGNVYKNNKNILTDYSYSLGEVVTYYTHNGQCVAILHEVEDSDGFSYIYLLQIENTGTSFSPQISLWCATQDGVEKTYVCANKVKIDGVAFGSQENLNEFYEVYDALASSASRTYREGAEKFPLAQMIRYRANDDNLVTDIDTITYNTAAETPQSLQLQEEYTIIPANTGTQDAGYYNTADKNVYINQSPGQTLFGVNDRTDVWRIPSNRDEFLLYETAPNGWSYGRAVEGYSVDSANGMADVAIFYVHPEQATGIYTGSRHCIVGDVWKQADEEGNIVTAFSTANEGKNYIINKDKSFSIAPGDIVIFRTSSNGEVVNLEKAYDAATNTMTRNPYARGTVAYSTITRSTYTYTVKGVPLSLKENRLKMYKGGTKDTTESTIAKDQANVDYFQLTTTTPIYIYDKEKGTVESAKTTDLITRALDYKSTQEVIVSLISSTMQYIYIIK